MILIITKSLIIQYRITNWESFWIISPTTWVTAITLSIAPNPGMMITITSGILIEQEIIGVNPITRI